MEVLPWAECLPCCLPHRLLLLQAELGWLSGGGSNPCNNTHCQLTSLGAGAGSPAILASLQALSQPDPSSSPKRSSLLVPRKTWCWSKVWEMGKAVPFCIFSSLSTSNSFQHLFTTVLPLKHLTHMCLSHNFSDPLLPQASPHRVHWLSSRSSTTLPIILFHFSTGIKLHFITLWRAVSG